MIKRYLTKRDNPWELLVLALCCILPGIALMLRQSPLLLNSQGNTLTYHAILLPTAAHIWGAVAVLFGLLFVWLYFYVLRYEDPENDRAHHHFLNHGWRLRALSWKPT